MSEVPAAESSSLQFDYSEAARRHFHDAVALKAMDPPRLGNADHLFGISAECALVAILKTDPTRANLFNSNGGLKDAPGTESVRVHMKQRWVLFDNSRRAKKVGKIGAAFDALWRAYPQNPFDGWSVEQRYLSEAAVAAEIPTETVEKHARAAKFCLELLDKAKTWNLPKAAK